MSCKRCIISTKKDGRVGQNIWENETHIIHNIMVSQFSASFWELLYKRIPSGICSMCWFHSSAPTKRQGSPAAAASASPVVDMLLRPSLVEVLRLVEVLLGAQELMGRWFVGLKLLRAPGRLAVGPHSLNKTHMEGFSFHFSRCSNQYLALSKQVSSPQLKMDYVIWLYWIHWY
jgi:hypothetical protein